MYFLFVLIVATLAQNHPAFQAGDLNASWACDDPQCPMVCRPKCAPANCTASCDVGFECEAIPQCSIDCPYTQDGILVSGSCPMCSTVCHPLACTNCTTVCEPVNCEWECFLPNNCPYPRCQLQAQAPACQSWSNTLKTSFAVLPLLLVLSTWLL